MAPLLPDVAGQLGADLSPFCAVQGLRFEAGADAAAGPWRNFFVGLVGCVAPHEDDILWPNQACGLLRWTSGLGPVGAAVACPADSAAGAGDSQVQRRAYPADSGMACGSAAAGRRPARSQVLHRDRVLYNVRNAWDVAKFLSDPAKEDVEAHRANLLRLAAEREYRAGWARHMLRRRWGAATLRAMGLDQRV